MFLPWQILLLVSCTSYYVESQQFLFTIPFQFIRTYHGVFFYQFTPLHVYYFWTMVVLLYVVCPSQYLDHCNYIGQTIGSLLLIAWKKYFSCIIPILPCVYGKYISYTMASYYNIMLFDVSHFFLSFFKYLPTFFQSTIFLAPKVIFLDFPSFCSNNKIYKFVIFFQNS